MDAPLVDLSPLEFLPLSSIKKLTSLFFSPGSACGEHHLDTLERALADGNPPDYETIKFTLHQLAGSAMQAGASRLGHTAKAIRADPTAYAHLAGLQQLRSLFIESANEMRSRGLLQDTADTQSADSTEQVRGEAVAMDESPTDHGAWFSSSQPPTAGVEWDASGPAIARAGGDDPTTSCTASASSAADDGIDFGAGKQLVDLGQYEGLPRPVMIRLLSMFYTPNGTQGSAFTNLDDIDSLLQSNPADVVGLVTARLQMFSGSALQAGALRLGQMASAYCLDPARHCNRESIQMLRATLFQSKRELEAKGLLQVDGSA